MFTAMTPGLVEQPQRSTPLPARHDRPSPFPRTDIRALVRARPVRVSAPLPAGSPAWIHTGHDAAEDGFVASPRAWIKCLLKRLDANRALGLGAEMAFWLFLSLLPLAAVVGVVAAKLAFGNWSVAAPLLDSLPGATRELLRVELGKMAAWNGGKVGLGAGVMFLWLASSGVHSIFDGIEIEAEAAPRPWWKKRIAALVTCVVLSAGAALLTLLVTGLGSTWRLLGGTTWWQALRFESSGLGEILRFALGAAVSFGLVCGLYWIAVPPATRRSMPIVPGALLATALHIAIGFGYGIYIKQVGDGGAYQAGLASIGVTLMALYLFCVVMLVGVEVNQMRSVHERARRLASTG